jgi:hypothetical protein
MGNATTTRTDASGEPTLTWGPGVAPEAVMVGRTLRYADRSSVVPDRPLSGRLSRS